MATISSRTTPAAMIATLGIADELAEGAPAALEGEEGAGPAPGEATATGCAATCLSMGLVWGGTLAVPAGRGPLGATLSAGAPADAPHFVQKLDWPNGAPHLVQKRRALVA